LKSYRQASLVEGLFSDKLGMMIAFTAGCVLRAIPEIVAYPYPTGYDVMNYYIPVLSNFNQDWGSIRGQFPLYVTMLHSISASTGLGAQETVVGAAIVIFGALSASLFCVGRSLLGLGSPKSLILAGGVILQISVLRTTWDLHRDVFALAMFLFMLCLIPRIDNTRRVRPKESAGLHLVVLLLILSAIVAGTNRITGFLCCITLIMYAMIAKSKAAALASVGAVASFVMFVVLGQNLWIVQNAADSLGTQPTGSQMPNQYNPENLAILFLSINGILIIPAIAGYTKMGQSLRLHGDTLGARALCLKIPLVVSAAGSLSWLIFPKAQSLVADRWIILFGVFVSIFAIYGIIKVLESLKTNHATIVGLGIFSYFIATSVAYEVLPYDNPLPLYAATRHYTEHFSPVTMQFNTIDIKDNSKMISTIYLINNSTAQNSVIVGPPDWKGFMQLYLHGNRTYAYSDNPSGLAASLKTSLHRPVYLIAIDTHNSTRFSISRQ